MSHLVLRCEFNDGRTFEAVPASFEPLTASQLESALKDPHAPIEFVFWTKEAEVDGVKIAEAGRVTTNITFPHSPAPYALVANGWLPMPFVMPQHFLIDRNVVASLKATRERGVSSPNIGFQWWVNMFEAQTCLFNPLLFAYEGCERRLPSKTEFVSAFQQGSIELAACLPKSRIVRYEREHVDAAYEQLMSIAARGERDAKFLTQVMPLILHRVSRAREKIVQNAILKLARELNIKNDAFVLIAVLSVLYEDIDGNAGSIGRRLLKPSVTYTPQDAYNAISDLRHIEVAAASQAVLLGQAFALCTNDRGLARFWASLEIESYCTENDLVHFHCSLGKDLMPRLNVEEIDQVLRLLKEEI